MFWALIYKKTKNFKDKIVSGGVLKITDIIIIDTSTPLMSSSVTIWQPPPPLKSAGVLYGWSLKHSNETLTGTTSGMWLLSIPSLIFFFKSKECLWLKGRIVCHLKDQIRAWILETLCRRSLLPTTRQKLSLVATWRSKEKEYLMHADNCAAVRCIQQKPTKLNIY